MKGAIMSSLIASVRTDITGHFTEVIAANVSAIGVGLFR